MGGAVDYFYLLNDADIEEVKELKRNIIKLDKKKEVNNV